MNEDYLRPEHFLLSVTTSVLIGLLMMAATRRPAETQGRFPMQTNEIIGYSAAELPTALDLMESTLEVGGKACLAICTEALPTEDELYDLYLGMLANGFHAYRPTARVIEGIPTTELILQKGSPSFAVIVPLLVPLFIIGLIAFGIVQIEAISKALLPLMIVGAVGLVAVALIVRKPAEKYIERVGATPRLAAATKKALAAS